MPAASSCRCRRSCSSSCRSAKATGNFTLVELTDGSVVRCKPETGFRVNGKQVELTLLSDRKIQVPLTALSLILKQAQDPKVLGHADWKTVLKNRKNRDFFVRWSDGRMNPIPGTFGDGKDSSLGFQTESGLKVELDLNHQAVVGWVFVNKADPNLPLPVCTVVDEQDNTILVKKVATEGDEVVATTLFGSELRFKPDQLARLDFSGGKRVYLSDLDPRILEERAEDKSQLVKDRNLDDGPLLLGGKKFAKGLSLFAPMVLAYPLGGRVQGVHRHARRRRGRRRQHPREGGDRRRWPGTLRPGNQEGRAAPRRAAQRQGHPGAAHQGASGRDPADRPPHDIADAKVTK